MNWKDAFVFWRKAGTSLRSSKRLLDAPLRYGKALFETFVRRCSQSHLSGDPLFKPLLANFALFATTLFLWTLMVHDEVDLILPSEAVLCPTMNATSLGKLMKLIKTRLGEKPFSISVPSELSVISERWLKYLISGVSDLRTSCEQSQA